MIDAIFMAIIGVCLYCIFLIVWLTDKTPQQIKKSKTYNYPRRIWTALKRLVICATAIVYSLFSSWAVGWSISWLEDIMYRMDTLVVVLFALLAGWLLLCIEQFVVPIVLFPLFYAFERVSISSLLCALVFGGMALFFMCGQWWSTEYFTLKLFLIDVAMTVFAIIAYVPICQVAMKSTKLYDAHKHWDEVLNTHTHKK